MSWSNSWDPPERVGYKNPPRRTRFKRGQSGNIGGRPKGTNSFSKLVAEVGDEKVTATEGNTSRRMSKRKALVYSIYGKAFKGDTQATKLIMDIENQGTGKVEFPNNAM